MRSKITVGRFLQLEVSCFRFYVGSKVKIVDGFKNSFIGKIADIQEDRVYLDCDGRSVLILLNTIERINHVRLGS